MGILVSFGDLFEVMAMVVCSVKREQLGSDLHHIDAAALVMLMLVATNLKLARDSLE